MPEEIELSEREREILRLVATGASNKEIAYKLVISPNTVKVHLRNIFAKVGVASRTEATLYAIRSGLLTAPVLSGTTVTPSPPQEEAQPLPAGDEVMAATGSADGVAVQEAPSRGGRLWLAAALALAIIAFTTLGALLWNSRAQLPNAPAAVPTMVLPARWLALANLPEAVQDLAGAVYASQIYITGGEGEAGLSAHTWRYDPVSDQWTTRADKPTPVSRASAALLGEKVYVPGGQGQDGKPIRRLEVYDPRADRWEQAALLPEARSAYALATFEGRMYLFGGWDGEKVCGSVFAYNPEQDQWEARTDMPTPRFFASAAVVDGKILVFGGLNEKVLDTVEAYYPSRDRPGENAWEALPAMPQPRAAAGPAVMADMVYLVGGEDQEGETKLSGLQFTPATGQWNMLDASPTPTGAHLLVLPLDTNLHILGGAVSGGTSRQHLAYQAVYNLVFPVIQ